MKFTPTHRSGNLWMKVTKLKARFRSHLQSRHMQTTALLPIRTSDGRLSYASYKDATEKAQIEAWARANGATVGAAALIRPPGALANIA